MGTMRVFKVWLLICPMVLSGGSLAFAQTNTFPDSGNVGIGTTSPQRKLHLVKTSLAGAPTPDVSSLLVLENETSSIMTLLASSSGNSQIHFGDPDSTEVGNIVYSHATDSMRFVTNNAERVRIDSAGNVIIGATSSLGIFDVYGASVVADDRRRLVQFFDTTAFAAGVGAGLDLAGKYDSSGTFASFGHIKGIKENGTDGNVAGALAFITRPASPGSPTERVRITSTGNVGIGTTSPTSKLHVSGSAKVTGDLTVDGNIAAKYQDVAEWVRTPARLAPGTVVVIDPQESNQVLPASQAYDTRVAGVVSAQPGIILGEAGEDKAKVAHSGRVKVKADAQFGSIQVGDLLVSSDTPGYAMRSVPVDVSGISLHRPGTIVGKALEPLREGQGEILVLLTLQ